MLLLLWPTRPLVPSRSSKTTVEGDEAARDSACACWEAREGTEVPDGWFGGPDGGFIGEVAPGGTATLGAPAFTAVVLVFGDPTLAMKSNAEDSPKYSPAGPSSLLLDWSR